MVQILPMYLVIRVANCSGSFGTRGFPGLKELVTLLIRESKSERSHGLPKVLTDLGENWSLHSDLIPRG